MDTAVLLAIFGIFSLVITGLFKLISDNGKITAKLSESIDKNTLSNQEIAQYTKEGNEQSAQRNGHLADIAAENARHMMQALKELKSQNIQEQTVEHQTVKNKE